MEKKEFYDYIMKMIAISKIGLTYSKDPYALDNYQEIQRESMKMLENFENINFDRPNYFTKDLYPTPNISVRTLIPNEKGEILMVREAGEGAYSLPGGWCDLGDSPKTAATNECKQEAGIDVEIVRLIGVLNVKPWVDPVAHSQYVIIFEGRQKSDFGEHCYETDDVGYFSLNDLPPLSRKNQKYLFDKIIDAYLNKKIIFD